MIPKDLFEKVHRIEITTSHLVTDVFAGEYHSVFKGRGMEFDEVREYQIGDDIRTIDWNVTARSGTVHVKKFVEERELTVMILVDGSLSCQFGTVRQLKSQLAAELAAVLAFSAIRNNDKVGLVIFSDTIEKFIPPRKGLRHVLRVIREALYFQALHRDGSGQAQGRLTDLNGPLEYLNKVTTRRTVSFLISDFFAPSIQTSFRKTLAVANKRHDVVAITLNDPREYELPDCRLLQLEDAETGKMVLIDSADAHLREQYSRKALLRLQERNRLFQSVGVDHIDVSTDSPYEGQLAKFFLLRRRRFR